MKKSSASTGNSNCVYVGLSTDGQHAVVVVDPSKEAIRLAFTRPEWDAFLAGVRRGEFNWDTLQVDPQFLSSPVQSAAMVAAGIRTVTS